MSGTVSHELSRVMLSELLLTEKDVTRVWLRAEMDRLVDPMLDSIFNRLTTKLTNGLERTQSSNAGDWAQLENHDRQHDQVDQPSSSHLIQQHLPNDPIHCNENQQSEMRPLVQPLICTYDQINFEHLSNEPNLFPAALSPTIANVQSNYNSNDQNLDVEDEDECYCDECIGVIEVEDDVDGDDDDDDDSVQLIEDDEELPRPLKKPRMESTQPHNATQAEVACQSPIQPTDSDYDHGEYNFDESLAIQQNQNDTNNTIASEIVDESITNPTQPNLAQSNRRFQCLQCPKSFHDKCKLKEHVRVHTGERPFACDQCDKCFSQMGNLTQHQRIHQNKKQFKCDHCGKRFTLKCERDSHLRTHAGERPYKCTFCDKTFTQMGHRKKHELAKHLHVNLYTGKPYRCKVCGHTANMRANVITHVRMVHFGLPHTTKEQRERNIFDDRDPGELVEKVL